MFSSIFRKSGNKAQPAAAAQTPSFTPRQRYDWRALAAPASVPYGEADTQVIQLLKFAPRFTLDIGCNTGSRGAAIKIQYPDSEVWGIEPNRNAAVMARTRLDRVIELPLEQVDWRAEGVAQGDIDTVLLFDVLEHFYDPWTALLGLRNQVSATAQMVVSVPNVRNVLLMQDLINGRWRYRPTGLLDITHIRFFTWTELLYMFYQTGYRVVGNGHTYDPGSKAIFERHCDGPFPARVALDRFEVEVGSLDDLQSLCAVQHIGIFQPAEYDALSSGEKALVDGPFPETLAYAGA